MHLFEELVFEAKVDAGDAGILYDDYKKLRSDPSAVEAQAEKTNK